jgi:hypothetical protein
MRSLGAFIVDLLIPCATMAVQQVCWLRRPYSVD